MNRKFLLTLTITSFASFAKTKKDEILRGQPTFGKNYEAGLVQNFIVAQVGKKKPSEVPPASPPADNKAANTDSTNLNFETPSLEPKKEESSSVSIGPINNLNFGGALDMRLYLPQMSGPTEKHMGFGQFDIHVAELFLTTNIGDHISVLAEQLLVTSKMGDTVGQDHGFVYAIFSSIPGMPEDLAIKVGRLRNRFGVDARLDSPANVLRSPVYKTIGQITDKSLEVSGLLGPIEFSVGVLNGAETLKVPITTTVPGANPDMDVDTRNGSKPVVARLSADPLDWFSIGVSGYTGRSYPVYSHYGFAMHDMVFNGHTDEGTLIYKNRAAVDAKISLGSKLDLYGEYMMGTDRQGGRTFDVRSYYGRLDYRLVPQKWTLQLQYEMFNDGRDFVVDSVTGKSYNDTGNFGASITYHMNDQALLRVAGLMDDRGLFRGKGGDDKAPEYMGVVQDSPKFLTGFQLADSDEALMLEYTEKSSMVAFRELFKRYEKPLFRYLHHKANRLGIGVIEDLFQKTWLKVHERRSSFDPELKFSSWLYTIALNNLRDHLDLSFVKHEFSAEEFSQFIQEQPDAEATLDAKLSLARLNEFANELSTIQRDVLELIELDDLSIADVSLKLSISQESVRQHLSRAKKKLKVLMKGDDS